MVVHSDREVAVEGSKQNGGVCLIPTAEAPSAVFVLRTDGAGRRIRFWQTGESSGKSLRFVIAVQILCPLKPGERSPDEIAVSTWLAMGQDCTVDGICFAYSPTQESEVHISFSEQSRGLIVDHRVLEAIDAHDQTRDKGEPDRASRGAHIAAFWSEVAQTTCVTGWSSGMALERLPNLAATVVNQREAGCSDDEILVGLRGMFREPLGGFEGNLVETCRHLTGIGQWVE